MTDTVCCICRMRPADFEELICEACATQAGLEQLDILAQSGIGRRRVSTRFVCRRCKVPCSLNGNIDNASDVTPFQCPWAFAACAWERAGDV